MLTYKRKVRQIEMEKEMQFARFEERANEITSCLSEIREFIAEANETRREIEQLADEMEQALVRHREMEAAYKEMNDRCEAIEKMRADTKRS